MILSVVLADQTDKTWLMHLAAVAFSGLDSFGAHQLAELCYVRSLRKLLQLGVCGGAYFRKEPPKFGICLVGLLMF